MAKEKLSDTESKAITMEEMKEIQREYMKKLNRNVIELSASIIEKNETTPKPIIRDGQEVVDEDTGEIKMYPINYSVKLSFDGAQKEIVVKKDWYDRLLMDGTRYLFTGRLSLVKSYGKEIVDVKFDGFTEL